MLANVNVTKLFPAAYKAQMAVEEAVEEAITVAGLDRLTVDLVKLRASQINGCAFCLRMHTQDAIKNGETADRLALVAAWWESQYFTPRGAGRPHHRRADHPHRRPAHLPRPQGGRREHPRREADRRPHLGRDLHQRLEPDRDLQPLPGRSVIRTV